MEIVSFDSSHLTAATAWFNSLPDNNLWSEAWLRRRIFEAPHYDPELTLAALDDGQPIGMVAGSLVDENGWIKLFLVHPARRRGGIGTALFDELEKRLIQRGAQSIHVGWEPLYFLLPGIDIRYTDAIVFLDRRGYETDRVVRVNMDVLLSGRHWRNKAEPARLAEHGLTVRRGRADDRAGLTALCESQNHTGWAVESGMALQHEQPTVFVAEKNGAICAFAVHSVTGPLHFGPMLTHPDLRGLGVGSVLLKHCLADLQEAGRTRCEIVWTGPITFYARAVGATMGKAFWTFFKSL